MAIEYTWSFPSLDVTYNEDGLTNVVNSVYWRYRANDGNYSTDVYGTVTLSAPGQPFVEFEDLTPEIVECWVVETLGPEAVDAMKINLANQIAIMKEPKTGTVLPPWI